MTTNEIRFYLHNFHKLESEIQELTNSLKECRLVNISGIKAQVITDMPLCHSNTSKTESQACARIERIGNIMYELKLKKRLLDSINFIYFRLKDPKTTIFELRYFVVPIGRPRYNWLEISKYVGESEDNCKKIDERIILKIQLNYIQNVTCVQKMSVI